MQPDDDYSIRNLTVEAEADWRFCFPTLNMHHRRSQGFTEQSQSDDQLVRASLNKAR